MIVNKTLEREDGTAVFSGELSEKELDLVVGIGLNYLLQQGLLPFTTNKEPIQTVEKGEQH